MLRLSTTDLRSQLRWSSDPTEISDIGVFSFLIYNPAQKIKPPKSVN